MSVTIWHNPNCSTSRKALEAIRAAGIEPTVVIYLKTPPGPSQIAQTCVSAGITPRQLVRRRGTDEAVLAAIDAAGDAELPALLSAHPAAIERPVVISAKGARLCRPLERLHEVVP